MDDRRSNNQWPDTSLSLTQLARPMFGLDLLKTDPQLSMREISRRLGISRNTVRRYIRSGTTEPVIGRQTIVELSRKVCAQAVHVT